MSEPVAVAADLRAMLDKGTPLPWNTGDGVGVWGSDPEAVIPVAYAYDNQPFDAALIVSAVNLLPGFIALMEAAQELKAAREAHAYAPSILTHDRLLAAEETVCAALGGLCTQADKDATDA